MAIIKEVRDRFAKDPDKAFRWVENDLYGRIRYVHPLVEALLELIDGTVKVDPYRAKEWALRTVALLEVASLEYHRPRQIEGDCDWSHLKPMALAVLASCFTMCKQETLGLTMLHRLRRRPGLPKDLQGSVFARIAVALLELQRCQEAELWAIRSVRIFEKSELKPRPFRCLPMALLIRAGVGIHRYERAEVEASRLFAAAEDAKQAATLADELIKNTFLLTERQRYKDLRAAAVNSVTVASALGAFAGVAIKAKELNTIQPDSAHWPKARWTQALSDCARSRSLPNDAKRAFLEARDGFEKRDLVDEAIQVTLDLQWWLIATGDLHHAAAESEWLRYHLSAMRFDRQVVEQWILAVERRQLTSEIVATVFREIRNIRRVPSPLDSCVG